MPTVTVEWRAYSAPFSLFYSLSTLLHLGSASRSCISIRHLHSASPFYISILHLHPAWVHAQVVQHFKSLQLHLLRIISAETVNKINFWFLTNKKLQSPISDSQVLNFRISRGWLLVLSIGGWRWNGCFRIESRCLRFRECHRERATFKRFHIGLPAKFPFRKELTLLD